ncbi:MAG: oligosaccharide flippase family protein [Chloroflexota bacterium]|nr:oligosaccharide flippase family protein [Chloroflexota bacterium]
MLKDRLVSVSKVSLYRNGIYVIGHSAIGAGAGFLFWAIAARYYDTGDVGIAAALISVVNLLAFIAPLGLDLSIIKFLPGSGKNARDLVNSCLTIICISTVFLAVIFIMGMSIWFPDALVLRENLLYGGVFVILCVMCTLDILTTQLFIAERKSVFALVKSAILNVIRFIPLILFTATWSKWEGIVLSWGIGAIASVMVTFGLLLPRLRKDYYPYPTVRFSILRDMVRFSFANYVTSSLWFIPPYVLPIIVLNVLGEDPSAHFYIGWAVGGILFNIPRSVSLSLFAEGSHAEENLGTNVRRSMKLVFMLLVPGALLIALLADLILNFFGEGFADNASVIVWVLALSAFPLSINHVYFGMRRAQGRMLNVITMTALIAAITLVGSYMMLSEVGIVGAAIAWLMAQTIVAVLVIRDLLLVVSDVKIDTNCAVDASIE